MANRRFIDFPIASTVGDSDIILIWQSGVNKQTTKATFLSGLPENLDELNDVVISGLTNGQILRYDSVTGKWENTDQGNLDLNDLNDVSIVSPSNGQVLVYNSSTSKWENSSGGFVPYVGAVTTVDLGAQGLRAGYVRFDTSVASVPDEQGLMYWDASRSTAALIMNGTLQHIGQDAFFYVKNSSGSTIPKGTCVRFAGTDGASGHLLVVPFLANGSVPSTYFMGVTSEEIANGSFGQVMHFGELTGINTSGFTAGDLLYASTTVAGGFQTTVPVAPNNIVLVAAAVNSKNNGAIVVRPTYGSNINIDEGVKITSPTTGDLLQLQAGGLWENKTIDGAGIVTKATSQVISGLKTFNVNTLMMQSSGNANAVYLSNSSGSSTYQSGFNFFGFNTDNHIYFSKSSITGGNTGILAWSNTANRTYTLKDASGTLAFTSDIPSLSGYVQGSGTTNYVSKFTGSGTIGNSQIFDNGTNVGIGTASPNATLQVRGDNGTSVSAVLRLRDTNSTSRTTRLQFEDYNGTLADGIIDFKIPTAGSATGARLDIGVDSAIMSLVRGGNVLIGTTTDNGARLQVSGTSTFSDNINTNRGNDRANILFNTTAGVFRWGMGLINTETGSNVGGDFTLFRYNDNGSFNNFALTVNRANGNVGIGTASPSDTIGYGRALDVQSSTGAALYLRDSDAPTTQYGFVAYDGNDNGLKFNNENSSGFIRFNTAGTERMRIKSNGDLKIQSGNLLGWSDYSAGSTGVGLLGSIENLQFYSSGSERMRITSSGNVGIGTTTDNGARLQVNGTATFSSSVTAETNNGRIIISPTGWRDPLRASILLRTKTNDAAEIDFQNTISGLNYGWQISSRESTTPSLIFFSNINGTFSSRLTLTSTGAATFSSSVTASGGVNAGDSKFFNSVQLTDSLGGTCQGFLWTDAANTLKIGTGTVAGVNVKMTITSTGNVGIGTSSPINGGGDAKWITLEGNSYGGGFISSVGGTAKGYLYYDNGTSNFIMQAPSSTGIGFYTNNAERLRITSGGNVLIGTTTDNGARLQVSGTSTFSSNVTVTGIYYGKQNSVYQNGSTDILNVGRDADMYGGSNSDGGVFVYGNNKLHLSTNSQRRLTIDGSGNVLIGTTTSGSSKLKINGLPTSSAGLASGDVWNDGGTLKIA